MTRIELENRVWLMASREEKKRITGSWTNVKGQICEESSGTWKGVCSCLIMTEISCNRLKNEKNLTQASTSMLDVVNIDMWVMKYDSGTTRRD
ncbi:hypothetical protein [uncultured Streptococcus sp.]|uniref:hypothetical protein n=1 Tax=uncultured Streptococcus sp. TaxID=83427 RepID=UPI0028D45C9B|nr:hypothetical protein [uncultured Streptococcus sp.]